MRAERSSGSFRSISPALAPGRLRYAFFTNAQGGILDDLMVANCGDHLLLVVNAACKEADEAHLRAQLGNECDVERLDRALIALQGPKAEAALALLAPECATMRFMDVRTLTLMGAECIGCALGLYRRGRVRDLNSADIAREIAEELLANTYVAPIGLGARDSLRLEAGLCLYGSDIDETTTPVEAGLSWAIQKVRRRGGAREGGFPGAEIILEQLEHGAPRHRVGLRPRGTGARARRRAAFRGRGRERTNRYGNLRRLRSEPQRPDCDGLSANRACGARHNSLRRAARQALACRCHERSRSSCRNTNAAEPPDIRRMHC